MSVLESATTWQDQLLDAMSTGEDAVVTTLQTIAEGVQPLANLLPEAPCAGQLPDAAQLVDSAFGFAYKLLANQQEFTTKLITAFKTEQSSAA